MSDDPACATCSSRPPRLFVVNAFHDDARDTEYHRRTKVERLPVPFTFNGIDIPTNYAGLVAIVERAAAEQPIDLLEIACHGTGAYPRRWREFSDPRPPHWTREQWAEHLARRNMTIDQYERGIAQMMNDQRDAPEAEGRLYYRRTGTTNPDHQRLETPGAALVGSSGELVSGTTIACNEHGHGTLSERLAKAVIEGGRIIWQTCNLANGMAPHGNFLQAFWWRAQGRIVSGAHGETLAGSTGLTGAPARPHHPSPSFEGSSTYGADGTYARSYEADPARNGPGIPAPDANKGPAPDWASPQTSPAARSPAPTSGSRTPGRTQPTRTPPAQTRPSRRG